MFWIGNDPPPFWNFSKNSSIMVQTGVPKDFYFYFKILSTKSDCETGMVTHFQVKVDKRSQLVIQEAESYTKLI